MIVVLTCVLKPLNPGCRRGTIGWHYLRAIQRVAVNSKQARTLDDIFADPLKSDIKWKDIESLIEALGGNVEQRSGSRVAFAIAGLSKTFHRPHPRACHQLV